MFVAHGRRSWWIFALCGGFFERLIVLSSRCCKITSVGFKVLLCLKSGLLSSNREGNANLDLTSEGAHPVKLENCEIKSSC